jgi:hypothetical protein
LEFCSLVPLKFTADTSEETPRCGAHPASFPTAASLLTAR